MRKVKRAGNQGEKNTSEQRFWKSCGGDGHINPDEYETFKMKEPPFYKEKAEMCCSTFKKVLCHKLSLDWPIFTN